MTRKQAYYHQYKITGIITAVAFCVPLCGVVAVTGVTCFRPWSEVEVGGIGKVRIALIITAVIISKSLLILTARQLLLY